MKWEFYSREKFKCPECGEYRFVRMVNENGDFYPYNVGRCDRENSCGYMYHASQWLKDNPDANKNFDFGKTEKPKRKVINAYYSLIPELFEFLKEEGERNLKRINQDLKPELKYIPEFRNYLQSVLNFDSNYISHKMIEYRIVDVPERNWELNKDGSYTLKGRTSIVYLYVSSNNEIRAAEQIFYDGFKRSKTIHNVILNKRFHRFGVNGKEYDIDTTEIKWCLFGEHLISKFPEKPIIVVEGVKTAFGMGLYYPEFNWIATGSSNRLLHLNFNTNHKVIFLPDAGFKGKKSYSEIWKDKIRKMYGVNFQYDVYDFNMDCSSEEIKNGCDILDIQIKDSERVKEVLKNLY